MDYKKNEKKKKNEPFNLEKFIDDIEQYNKECKIRLLFDMFEKQRLKDFNKRRKKLLDALGFDKILPIRFNEDIELMNILSNLRPTKQTNKIRLEWM